MREFTSQPASGAWDVDVTIGQKLLATSTYHQQVPLEITCISATGEVFEDQVTVGDAITSVSLVAPFEPAMVVLNRHQRLNQNRLDHEERFGPGQFVASTLPYVDFRLYNDTVVDSTLVRVEHIWAGPDQTPLSSDVIEISNTHYWNVDGLWPEGTVLSSRLFYQGGVANGFDVDLVDGDESGMAVLYRPDPNAEWMVYPEQEVMAGSLTNGNGYMNVNNLRKGQYTFGKINGFVSVNEAARDEEQFELFPVPADNSVTLKATLDGDHLLILDIYDASGRRVQRTTAPMRNAIQQLIDISGITEGTYSLKVLTSLGVELGTLPFIISR
ncbi:MAG: T9SS type A sorting domain-containing protein [Flavobacteriales bacterium]|nr:T9SS type A sorting domain-containing protein [Flavobacteriales bacterium]